VRAPFTHAHAERERRERRCRSSSGVEKAAGEAISTTMASPQYKELLAEEANGILTITFNRPKRKNAMNPDLYIDLISALRFARTRETVRVMILTGAGDYYSSGNDLSNFTTVDMSDSDTIQKLMKDSRRMLEELVEEFIAFPKILIALVNGPAIGVGCTHLALCDFVYTTDRYVNPLMELEQERPSLTRHKLPPAVHGSIPLSSPLHRFPSAALHTHSRRYLDQLERMTS